MMNRTAVLTVAAALIASQSAMQAQVQRTTQSHREPVRMELAAGRTIKWKFEDGPMAGVEVEHDLNADGSITWRIADGPHKGTAVREKQYDAHRVSENVWTLSYLAASGHTLTAVLNFTDGRVIAYGSDNVTWTPNHGRFEIVR